VVLTKDNLPKRSWNGSMKCGFCDVDETIRHSVSQLFLFYFCAPLSLVLLS
jgi:hypothetical protein